MKNDTNEKALDCIAVKRDAQEKIYQEIKSLTPDEEIAYFKKTAAVGRLGEWWKKVSGTVYAE